MSKMYRGVPLPDSCTRAVLREMKRKLRNIKDRWSFYTCNEYGFILAKHDAELGSSMRKEQKELYFKARKDWSDFLGTLDFSVSGDGFNLDNLPAWFKLKFATRADTDDYNRLLLIEDILKECYND